MPSASRLVVLAILDGWGLGKPGPWNAISQAQTPNMVSFWQHYPHTHLVAKGTAVGLPPEVTGNSEVGHLNLGAGFIVLQDEARINEAIKDDSFFTNKALVAACHNAIQNDRNLHLITLIGPGQVHSNIDHLWAMLKLAKKLKVSKVYVHAISDGRDSSPTWLGKNAAAVQDKIVALGGQLVSVSGRYFAMDRDKRWDRTAMYYKLLTQRQGHHAADLASAVKLSYDHSITDEFIEPTVIGNGKPILAGDSVVMLNFRTDRPRQIAWALNDPHFSDFDRPLVANHLTFVTMTQYQEGLPADVAFAPILVKEPLAEVISKAELTQLHAAETEKYAHVTYFFNGGREQPFPGEDRLLIPSPKVATYDLQPQMSAPQLTQAVCQKLSTQNYDAVILNFANADMVAHTGNLEATIEAVQTVDSCLGQLFQEIEKQNGVLFITADHGNAEVLYDPVTKAVDTEHNSADVPFMAVGKDLPGQLSPGSLANVAPTILAFLGLPIPKAMTGEPLWHEAEP